MLNIGRWQPLARSALRMVVGFTFSLHGFQKLLGLLGGMGFLALQTEEANGSPPARVESAAVEADFDY